MTGYYSNLALHISDATLKSRRRLERPQRGSWSHVVWAVLGASAIWTLAIVLT
jgi:hypothetical protein